MLRHEAFGTNGKMQSPVLKNTSTSVKQWKINNFIAKAAKLIAGNSMTVLWATVHLHEGQNMF